MIRQNTNPNARRSPLKSLSLDLKMFNPILKIVVLTSTQMSHSYRQSYNNMFWVLGKSAPVLVVASENHAAPQKSSTPSKPGLRLLLLLLRVTLRRYEIMKKRGGRVDSPITSNTLEPKYLHTTAPYCLKCL